MWLIQKLTPDHKTIARFRSDNAAALKCVFRDFTKLCLKLGLFGRELAAIDGSKFKAVNSKERNFNESKLKDRIKRLNAHIDKYMQQLDESDEEEDTQDTTDVKRIIADLKIRKSDVCYNVQTSVDAKNKLVAEFEVTNHANDMTSLAQMAKSTADILEKPGIMIVADTGYNNAREIASCIMQGLDPHVAGSDGELCIPCDEHEAEEIISHENARGVYVKERNIVICPMGKVMYPGCYKRNDKSARYYNGKACSACICKCTDSKYRTFDIRMKKSEFSKDYDIDSLYVKKVKIKVQSEIIKKRKTLIEHPFGTIKRAMGADHVLTKGLHKVTGEFSLVFLAYNLKRVLNIIGAKDLINALG
jgi:hypothetical protein